MTLSKYIRDLLFRYECVIIPEFGGFLTKTVSAYIDKKSHTFFPPSKRLGFNSQLTENDGLLANYIASVNKLSYEEAMGVINSEVTNWKEKLTNQDIILDNIGIFSLNSEGRLLFEPDPNANFLTDSFGLTTVVAPAVSRIDYMEEEVVFDSISDFVNEELQKKEKKKKLSPFFKFAASLALLLAIGYFVMNQVYTTKTNKIVTTNAEKEASINKRIQEATFEINKVLPAITLQIETTEDNLLNQENEYNTNPNKKVEEDAESDISNETTNLTNINKFHIIGGAFNIPSNATKKVKQLKAKGYEANIVGKNKRGLTQVAFGSYATRKEALIILRKIRATEEKNAWMLIK